MKQWKDWIIFLGFYNNRYDDVISAVNKMNRHAAEHGFSEDGSAHITELLFENNAIFMHSCCLSFKSMHIDCDYIIADWIDYGGLKNIDKMFFYYGVREFSDTYDNYTIKDGKVFFLTDYRYQVIGITLDGKIVMDTFKEYGNPSTLIDKHDYCKKFMETVNKNYQKLMLPAVPNGILKLPLSI